MSFFEFENPASTCLQSNDDKLIYGRIIFHIIIAYFKWLVDRMALLSFGRQTRNQGFIIMGYFDPIVLVHYYVIHYWGATLYFH